MPPASKADCVYPHSVGAVSHIEWKCSSARHISMLKMVKVPCLKKFQLDIIDQFDMSVEQEWS